MKDYNSTIRLLLVCLHFLQKSGRNEFGCESGNTLNGNYKAPVVFDALDVTLITFEYAVNDSHAVTFVELRAILSQILKTRVLNVAELYERFHLFIRNDQWLSGPMVKIRRYAAYMFQSDHVQTLTS